MYALSFRPRVVTIPIALLIWIVILLAGCTAVAPTTPAAPVAADEAAEIVEAESYTLRFTETGMEIPEVVPSGIVPVRFETGPTVPALALVGRLHEGLGMDDVTVAMMEGGPLAALGQISLLGGAMLGPDESREIIFDLQAGEYVILNLAGEMPGVGGFQVAADTVSSMAPPQTDIVIDMVDFAYAMPDTLPAGRHLWEIKNSGQQWHEFTVTRLAEGTTPGDFLAMVQAMAESDGPPPPDAFAFFWMPSGAGERAWVEVDLEAGTYGFACLLPDLAAQDGEHSHLDRGMLRVVTVK
jgi:hypothetical protein